MGVEVLLLAGMTGLFEEDRRAWPGSLLEGGSCIVLV